MRLAILILMSVALFVITTSLWNTTSNSQQEQNRQSQQPREDPTSLRARLKKAKPNANNEVVFGSPDPILADVGSLGEALNNYSLIIGRPVDNISVQSDPRNIVTYYRFLILESLSQNPLPFSGVPENVASELPPLNKNEIYIIEGGGSVVIDGVKVTQSSSHEYSQSQKYLLFVSKNASQTIGMVTLGKYGVFRIKDDNDTLEPIASDVAPVARDLKEHYANKLSKLKSVLKRN